MSRITVKAETPANVWQIRCAVGERVVAGQELLILESMKMEIPVEAPASGVVCELLVAEGRAVKEGDALAIIEGD